MCDQNEQRETSHVHLLQRAARAANESRGIDDALQKGLELVCEHSGWSVGHAFLPAHVSKGSNGDSKSSEHLISRKIWYIDDPQRFESFRSLTEATRVGCGVGLPGGVYASGGPMWISDISAEPQRSRTKCATACGLQSGFALPIPVCEEIVGVLEFFSTESRPRDEHLLEVASDIGAQIGRVFERQRAQQELVEREEQLRAVLDATEQMPVTLWGPDGTVRSVWDLPSSASMPAEALEGRNIRGLAPAEYLERILEILRHVTEMGEIVREEHRRLEEKMRQTQKLESLGVLVGGIAHDFNNLLVGIQGNALMALRDVDSNSPAHAMLRDICEAGEQAADLTREILAYAGKGKIAVEPVELSTLVEDMTNLLRSSVPRNAELRFEGDMGPSWVEGDPTQLRQVVMNVIINAAESLEKHCGTVCIRTGIEKVDSEHLTHCFPADDVPEGEYAYFEVRDSGLGMSEETLQRVFDPFFTTKHQGRGLGLAAVLGIVRNHRGTLRIMSGLDSGTVFRVFLPAIDSNQQIQGRTDDRDQEREGPPGGTGTVIVVDDERAVRAVASRMLVRGGYEVLSASGGEEAIELLIAHAEDVVAVLLDATMPHMDGEATFHALRGIRSDVPVVFCTGYSEFEIEHILRGKKRVLFLQKPFTLATLTSRVREAIEL